MKVALLRRGQEADRVRDDPSADLAGLEVPERAARPRVEGEDAAFEARCSFAYAGDFATVEYRCESGEKGKTWVSRAGKAAKVVPSVTTVMGTGDVLGIHELVLKPGVAPAELERFAAEEFGPVLKDVFPGIRVRLYKGERGGPRAGTASPS